MAGKPVGSFYVQLGLNTKEFQKNLKRSERDLKQAFGSAAIRTSQMLAAAMAGLAAATAAVGVAAVKMAADLERQQVAFTRLLGSAEAASKRLKSLQEFAAVTPYTFTELVEYEKRLLALGFGANETRSILSMLGDTAAGLGMNADGVGRLVKALGDIRSKGAVATQELNQLAEAGVPAREILAKGLGVSTAEMLKMVEDRTVSAATAITILMEGLNKRFGGMMELQSKTMLGMWSTVQGEGENVLRILGQQITASASLREAMEGLKNTAMEFRAVLEDQGLGAAFSGMFGPKTKIAIMAIAGAITGALVPAVIALSISLALISKPLAILVAIGAIAGAAGGALYAMGEKMKSGMNIAKEAASIAFEFIKNKALIVVNEVLSAVKGAIAQVAGMFERSAAYHGLSGMAKDFKQLADGMKSAAIEDAGNADLMRSQNDVIAARLSILWEAYNASTAWIDLMNSAGASNIFSVYDKVTDSVTRLKNVMLDATGVASFFNNIIGRGEKANLYNSLGGSGGTKTAKAPKKEGKSDREKLIEEAARQSEQIKDLWKRETSTKEELLDYEYQKEFEALAKTKSANKNYLEDLQRLTEVYSTKGRKMAEEDTAAKLEYLNVAKTEEIKALADRDAAYFEAFERKQELADLETQLLADTRAGDLAAYVEHLNAKTAAERAHLEGRRQLIQVYDELMMASQRSQASYMAETYQTVYSGLTDALTGIITGAKSAGEAFKQLGMQLIQMVVKWQIQRKLSAVMAKSIQVSELAVSTTMAAATAAAWAPAAAMVAAATFGASTASAAAGLTSLTALSRGLAIPGLANGGLVTGPTLAMVGEGKSDELVLPLNDRILSKIGGGEITINVINQTGQPVAARSSQRMDGAATVIDLFLEGYSRNMRGIQDVMGGR